MNIVGSSDRTRVPAKALPRLCALLTAIGMGASAAAQVEQPEAERAQNLGDLSLDELMGLKVDVVYGASRYEQKVTRAPSSISIVTADEIGKLGYRTLAEVLRGVRGLYVSDDRNYSYLGVRGFLRPNDYNTRVLVLIDGHRMNDNLFDSGTVAREGMVDIALIDRVEVIRGPSSSIYGSSAFFGVINVVTRRGGQLKGAELSTEAGSFDTYKSTASMGGRLDNGFEWLFSVANYDSGGAARLYIPEFDQRISANPRATNNGIAADLDGERAFNVFSSLGYGDFDVTAFFSDRVKRVPTASFGTVFADGREETTDYRGYVDVKFGHDFSASMNLKGQVFYDNYTYRGAYPYPDVVADELQDTVSLQRDGTVGEWVGTQWQLTARLLNRHTVIVGAEYRDNIREYQYSYYDSAPGLYDWHDDRSSQVLGMFAQDEMALTKDVALTAGVRYDYYVDSFGGTTSPRLGLIYSPGETTTFKALFGKAYRAPNPYERFYNVVQEDQPELRPETIKTYELVAEQYIGANYRLNASAYYYDIRGLISQAVTDEDEPYFANLQSANAVGIELEGQAKFDSGLTARVSYTLQRTEDGQTDRVLTSSPRHLGKLSVIAPFAQGKVFGGIDLQYNGASVTESGTRADGFTTANLTLYTPRLFKNLSLSFNVYNVLDTRYGYSGAADHAQDVIEQDGRAFRGAAAYKF
jgi:outer membrane receptor for ferrienterochelin and colicins